MKVRLWQVIVTAIALILAFAALYVMREVWLASEQIDTWSQIKYNPASQGTELPVEIVGHKFEWRVRYPSSRRLLNDLQLVEDFAREARANQEKSDDVHLVNELHLWKEGKVQVFLKTADVPHSFFVPALRLKQEAVPGKVIDAWLVSTHSNVIWDAESADWKCEDEWEFVCAEHFRQERKMSGQLLVHETKEDFLKWLKRSESK